MRRALLTGMLLVLWLLPAAGAQAADDDVHGDDRIVVVGSVLVDRDETVHDVVVIDGDVTIRGTVTGDVIVVDGDITIRGTVEGDVVAVAGLATLGQRGRIAGDLVYGDERPVQAPGSQVEGDVEKFEIGDVSVLAAIGLWIGFTLSMLLLGLVALLIAPRAGEALARTGGAKPLPAAGIGLLAFFLLPVLAVLAIVTIIGLPLGIVLLLLIVPLYVFGYLTAALVLGRRIARKGSLLAFVIGLVILQLVALIPVFGGLVAFLATVFGLGVLLLALFRARA